MPSSSNTSGRLTYNREKQANICNLSKSGEQEDEIEINSTNRASHMSDTVRKDKFQEVVNYENIDDMNLYQQTEIWIQ